jgi:hypothetical protein
MTSKMVKYLRSIELVDDFHQLGWIARMIRAPGWRGRSHLQRGRFYAYLDLPGPR